MTNRVALATVVTPPTAGYGSVTLGGVERACAFPAQYWPTAPAAGDPVWVSRAATGELLATGKGDAA